MKDYEMTQDQFDKILKASQPVMMIALQCGNPGHPQENANAAWQALGNEMGFKYMTVKPSKKGNRFFSAEPIITLPTYEAKQAWIKAIRAAMAECTVSAKRSKDAVGARTCFEIKDAIFDLLDKQ